MKIKLVKIKYKKERGRSLEEGQQHQKNDNNNNQYQRNSIINNKRQPIKQSNQAATQASSKQRSKHV